MMTRWSPKTYPSQAFATAILFALSLSMACGRTEMLSEEEEAATGPGAAGRSGNIPASLGGAGAGGGSKSSSSGGAPTSSAIGSKPVGSGGSGQSGGTSSTTASTKPTAGAIGGGGGGGVSAVAGSKTSSGMGGVSALAGSKASGGTSAVGGTTSTLTCTDAKACGGDVVGTWNVTSSCLTISGQMDMSTFGLGCSRAAVDGSLQVSGIWIAKSNGVYSDKTITSGNLQISLPASCLKISGTTARCKDVSSVFMSLGYSGMICNDAPGGGCTCPGAIKQSGSMGVISLNPWTSGVYETTGNVLVIDSTNRYGYCASATQMTLTPQGKNPPTTGAIILQKQ